MKNINEIRKRYSCFFHHLSHSIFNYIDVDEEIDSNDFEIDSNDFEFISI